MKTFGRVLTAMITSFNNDGSLNIENSVAIAHHLLDNGSDGLVVCGTTGENPSMSKEDKLALFTAIAKECGHNHEALRIHQSLADIIKAMFITTNPIPVKYAVRKIGLPAGVFNLPMCDPSAEEAAYIDKALTEYIK